MRWLIAGEFAVGDGVRAGRVFTQSLDLVCFVSFEVSFELEPLSFFDVALPGEDVGTGAVQEPAVVGDHHGAARELGEGIFQ